MTCSNNNLIFTWKIYNFSFHESFGSESINSPYFNVAGIDFNLNLFPKESELFLGLYLMPKFLDFPPNFTFKYKLSIRKDDGQFKEKEETSLNDDIHPLTGQHFISWREIKTYACVDKEDILTLRCKLWHNEADLTNITESFADTHIKVNKIEFLWIIENIMDDCGEPKNPFQHDSPALHFSSCERSEIKLKLYTGNGLEEDLIYFGISSNIYTETFLSARYIVYLLDTKGNCALSISGKILFQNDDMHNFKFLSKRNLFDKKYLLDGKLSLKCHLSFGTTYVTDLVVYGNPITIENQGSHPRKDHPRKSRKPSAEEGHRLWIENQNSLFSDQTFSDFIVRSNNHDYKVHKAILCAHSEMFSKMLSIDMAESNSGVLKITEFDDAVVLRLLLYLYTSQLEGLTHELAIELYSAANLYCIKPLKSLCHNYLLENLNYESVCETLQIARQLNDNHLTSAARDFIFLHRIEIINSEGWEFLKKYHSNIISELTEWILLHKVRE